MPETAATVQRIRARLCAALQTDAVNVEDDSALHAGHEGARGGGGHYRLHVTSARFEGLARLARHRLVYDALRDLMTADIHALTMTLLTPAEARGVPSENLPGN
jgi:BolA protein